MVDMGQYQIANHGRRNAVGSWEAVLTGENKITRAQTVSENLAGTRASLKLIVLFYAPFCSVMLDIDLMNSLVKMGSYQRKTPEFQTWNRNLLNKPFCAK